VHTRLPVLRVANRRSKTKQARLASPPSRRGYVQSSPCCQLTYEIASSRPDYSSPLRTLSENAPTPFTRSRQPIAGREPTERGERMEDSRRLTSAWRRPLSRAPRARASCIRKKGKIVAVHVMKTSVQLRYSSTHSITQHWLEVGGQVQATAALPPKEEPSNTH